MNLNKLNKVAKYLATQGLYKEAADLQKMIKSLDEDTDSSVDSKKPDDQNKPSDENLPTDDDVIDYLEGLMKGYPYNFS